MKTIKEGTIYARKGEKGKDRWWDRMVCVVSNGNVVYSQRLDRDFDNVLCQRCTESQFKRIMNLNTQQELNINKK